MGKKLTLYIEKDKFCLVENEIPFIFIMFGRELGPEKSAGEQREETRDKMVSSRKIRKLRRKLKVCSTCNKWVTILNFTQKYRHTHTHTHTHFVS